MIFGAMRATQAVVKGRSKEDLNFCDIASVFYQSSLNPIQAFYSLETSVFHIVS